MNNFLVYLMNSSICLSILYLFFRALMRKETYFKLNRIVLLSIVLCSLIIPKLIMPQFVQQAIQQPIDFELPVFKVENNLLQEITKTDETSQKVETTRSSYVPEKITQSHISIQEILVCLYITGILITFLILVYGLILIFILYRNAKAIRMAGYQLLIAEKEIAAFSFGHLVFISQRDYEEHQQIILAHEREHIRFGHFYDLIFLEILKIIYWFNPFIYRLIRDLKDIHEFQADNHTLTTGIDATKYQLLIIQKSVGHQKFALANSFNHCQIKNRIVMMNKSKTGKAWRWKATAFLPLLALLLIFCGRKGNNVPVDQNKQENRLDTIINGKKLIVNDTTQYDSSFIKELKESYAGYETLIVKDDSFLITTHLKFPGKDTVVTHKYTIPTNLELNKEIVFSAKNEGKSLVLKRTNYTNIEYQIKNAKETIKSGTAILQSTFYLGAEMDHDENGKEIVSRQYLNQGSDWAAITVEIYDAKIASITYCVDTKANIYETLSQLKREPLKEARVSYHQSSNKDFSIEPYEKFLNGILDDLDKDKKLSIEQIQTAIPKNQDELGNFVSYYANNNIYHKDIWKLYDMIIVEALKKNKNVFKSYLLMSDFVDGWIAEEYFDNIEKLIKNDKKFFCEMYTELPKEKITRLKNKFDSNCN